MVLGYSLRITSRRPRFSLEQGTNGPRPIRELYQEEQALANPPLSKVPVGHRAPDQTIGILRHMRYFAMVYSMSSGISTRSTSRTSYDNRPTIDFAEHPFGFTWALRRPTEVLKR